MKKEITITRVLNAPRERVWQAWTDPQQVARWWGPHGVTNPTCEIDLKVGGTINIVMLAGPELGALAGQRWPMSGTFEEIVPPDPSNSSEQAKLVFSNNATDVDGSVLLSGQTVVLFEEEDGKTKVTVKTGAEGDAPGTDQMLGGMEQGWNQQMDKLIEFTAVRSS